MIKNTSENDKRDKYNVGKRQKDIEKRTFNTYIFASEMEMKFYRDVLLPELQNGKILSIDMQPKFILQEEFVKYERKILPIYYIADFRVVYSDNSVIVYEVKGFPSESAKIKRKMFDFRYPQITLKWISESKKYGGWLQYDDLKEKRSKAKRKRENAEKNI